MDFEQFYPAAETVTIELYSPTQHDGTIVTIPASMCIGFGALRMPVPMPLSAVYVAETEPKRVQRNYTEDMYEWDGTVSERGHRRYRWQRRND